MIKVQFSFDPETNEVLDLIVDGVVKKAAAPKAAPVKRKSSKKESTTVVLNGNSLQLNQEVLDLLQVEVADRLCIRFKDNKALLVTPEVANEPKGGNLVNKSLTISARGKTGELLSKIGTEFDYHLKQDGMVELTLHGDAPQAELELDTPVAQDDEDFLSQIDLEDGEEVEFEFNN